ncbi:esterase [Geodermatophilus sp. YIM 151500]|uniref:esterase n=1 Tax=Geodermatophilus sp. YIM 151500 TaxID=2984531 RepID=UPI0021E428B2|nr:esterase [Geodermatophilus sp. YIM 151500]MCV2491030.1 esterase [Geodermatophilus sp. YIM 151500]
MGRAPTRSFLIALVTGLVAACSPSAATTEPTATPEPTATAAATEFTEPTDPTAAQDRSPPPATEYFVDEAKLPFGPPANGVETTRRWGVLGGAGFRIEVPESWNGDLVVHAHGYRGTGPELTVDDPPLREHLVARGYAWAASSYDENGYDVGSGVRSTHRLVEHFDATVREPRRRYLSGVSMGGHVTGVTLETFPDEYDGALPVCGVMGDRRLFDTFLDYNAAAQALVPDTATLPVYPAPGDYVTTVVPQQIAPALGTPYPLVPTEAGEDLRALTVQRTGGDRPLTDRGFAEWAQFLFTLYPTDPGLGEEPGPVGGNAGTVYQLDADPALTTEERALNEEILRVEAAPGGGGLTGVPTIDGRPSVPVLTLHGLGDLFVPFSMEQEYARDVAARGDPDLLVQRAVRTVAHCDFSPQEWTTAFDDLVRWVEDGVRPAGDDVLDPVVVADPGYGCRSTVPLRPYDPGCG